MTTKWTLKDMTVEIGLAIRQPERLALRWHEAEGSAVTTLIVILLINAAFGVAAYGLTMQFHNGSLAMLRAALFTPLAAGGAWVMALPALYIFNRALGSRMHLQATLIAASVTVCFGAWAMLASVPINWFFSLSLPYANLRLLTNIVVFTGVGICMADVFLRILQALEPERSARYGYIWVGLLAVIGMELFILFDIFEF